MDMKTANLILIADKPAGITSAGLVRVIKKITGARKVGHAGTLDPFATGVMLCFLNQATKLARFFLEGSKTYQAELQLGLATDTQDFTGQIMMEKSVQVSKDQIMQTFADFKGVIMQKPPIYSALKQNGQPLYKLARQGRPVQKPARQVHIMELEVESIDFETNRIIFKTACSAGTYIRTMAADIGAALGCGAHLIALRRTETCGFKIKDALNLDQIKARADLADVCIGMTRALEKMSVIKADSSLAHKVSHGQRIPKLGEQKGYFKVLDQDLNLLAVLKADLTKNFYQYCCVFN